VAVAAVAISQRSTGTSPDGGEQFSKHGVVLGQVLSVWEIQIKLQVGKLTLDLPLNEMVQRQLDNGIVILPINLFHVWKLDALPAIHKDPFDRLLIAQSLAEDATIMSNDAAFEKYPVRRVW